jgi:hypothetical protein
VDLGTPLAFLAPAAFWIGVRGLPPRRAALAGFAAGLAAHSLVLHWIYVVGHASSPLGVVAVVTLASYIALFGGVLGGASAALAPAARGLAGPLVLAALWTARSATRSTPTSGFARSHRTAASTRCRSRPRSAAQRSPPHTHASSAPPRSPRRSSPSCTPRARMHPRRPRRRARSPSQGNIDQGAKWSPEWAERTLAIYEELTRTAAERGAEIVVWPETAVPGSPDADPGLQRRLEELARATGATLVVGAVGIDGYDPTRRSAGPVRYFDSAYVLDPARGPVDGRPLRQGTPRAVRRVRAVPRVPRPVLLRGRARHRERRRHPGCGTSQCRPPGAPGGRRRAARGDPDLL